jgi:hypothetical protein
VVVPQMVVRVVRADADPEDGSIADGHDA